MIPGYLKTLREMNRRGAKGSDPLNALNALNAQPRLERPATNGAVINEYENADSVGRSAARSQTSTCAKSAISAKSPSPYQSEFDALERRCPDFIDAERWRQAVEDGRQFLATWGDQAQALEWTARELFGLHTPPERPAGRYSRLSRYDDTGLIWLLRGRPVIALTETIAAIQGATAVLTYRKLNKPALGPLGDSLDDMGPSA